MCTPKEMVVAIAALTGTPASEVTTHDRNLAVAGLRNVGGRGLGAARMTSLDAARLLVACVASRNCKDSASTVALFSEQIRRIADDIDKGEPQPVYEFNLPHRGLSFYRTGFDGEVVSRVADLLAGRSASPPPDDTLLANDVLRGADEIAAHLGLNRRQVYHAASSGKLPVFHIGSIVHARKSTLAAWIRSQEMGA